MSEFTGERIIPGQVEPDLWNEHAARYWFARQYAAGKRVLDAGCGTGYGAHALAECAESVAAIDIASEALAYAGAQYARPNLSFAQASCSSLPLADRSFDLAVSFEVIEHVENWRGCLEEFRRVLAPGGVLIVSTPNREYYAESRRESGPNPFHVHEFDHVEFAAALEELFPQVDLLAQNHADGVLLQPFRGGPGGSASIENPHADPDGANFFVAVCRLASGPPPSAFVFLPSAANVLREREKHIAMLARDVERLRSEKHNLVEMFREQNAKLADSNRWAAELDASLDATRERIAELQGELAAVQETAAAHISRLEAEKQQTAAGYEAHIARLDEEKKAIAAAYEGEIAKVSAELEQKCTELAECVRKLDTAEATVVERSNWALTLEGEVAQLRAELAELQASRWVRIGKAIGVSHEPGEKRP